jgi:hypothetical protein
MGSEAAETRPDQAITLAACEKCGLDRGSRFVGRLLGALNHLGEGRFCWPETLHPDPSGTHKTTVRAVLFGGQRRPTMLHQEGAEKDLAIARPLPPPAPGRQLRMSVAVSSRASSAGLSRNATFTQLRWIAATPQAHEASL